MADSDSTETQLADDAGPGQTIQKARDILSGMSVHRIDPSRITMIETEPCAKGGQGVVVIGTLSHPEAPQESLPEVKVAVKKLEWKRDDADESSKFFKSYVNELTLTASLSHPNIIMLVGFVEDLQKGDAWIILPWEANGNIREFLQSGEWDIPERISLIQDTAKGLEYLHSQQPPICHGDLKSFNILVNSSHHAVITDFGSARIRRSLGPEKQDSGRAGAAACDDQVEGSASPKAQFNPSTMELTLTGPRFSLRWTAPEVLNNGIQDLASDMWALGWVCWEVVTGQIPFEDLNRESVIIVHAIKGKLPAIREDASLSLVLMLCSLMSDCWVSEPVKRIHVSTFQLKVAKMVSPSIEKNETIDFEMTIRQPSETPSGHTASGQKVRSARLLLQLGRMYELHYDLAMAESHYSSSLDVATRTNDDSVKAHALGCLGDLYRARSNHREAESAYKQAQDIHSRIGNDLGTANALNGLGETYRTQLRIQESEKAFMIAHEIYSRIGDDVGAANALNNLGESYRAQLRNQEAEKAFKEAHEIHSRIGSDLGVATALAGLGGIYRFQLRNQEAERAFAEAYKIYARIGDSCGAAYALHGLGSTYLAQSRNQESEKIFILAHEISSRVGDDFYAANALNGLGESYHAQLRYQEAEKTFSEAYEIHSRIGNDSGSAIALSGLGNTYQAQSRNHEAEKALMEARKIYRRIGNDFKTGSTARSHIMAYCHQRRNDGTDVSYPRAQATSDSSDADDSRARTLIALGETHYAQCEYLEAEDAVTEALAIWLSVGNEPGQAIASLLLSQIFKSQSKSVEEMAALIQAEAALSRIGDHELLAWTLDRLGDLHYVQGTYIKAGEHYRRAQAIFSSMGDVRGEANVLLSLGRISVLQDRQDGAEKCFAQARTAFASIADDDNIANSLDGLTGVYTRQGKFTEAKAACMDAREVYKRMGRPMSKICASAWDLYELSD